MAGFKLLELIGKCYQRIYFNSVVIKQVGMRLINQNQVIAFLLEGFEAESGFLSKDWEVLHREILPRSRGTLPAAKQPREGRRCGHQFLHLGKGLERRSGPFLFASPYSVADVQHYRWTPLTGQ